MDGTSYVLLVDLPLLTLALAVAGAIVFNRNGGTVTALGHSGPMDMKVIGIVAMVGLWLLLTAASMWCAFLAGLALFYVLLFWLGHAAAWIGALSILAFLAAIPFLWAWALLSLGEPEQDA